METPPPTPDDKRLFLLLCSMGLGKEDAYTFVQEVQNMAAANLIARFEAKLDAVRWMLGLVLALLIALLGLLVAQAFRDPSPSPSPVVTIERGPAAQAPATGEPSP